MRIGGKRASSYTQSEIKSMLYRYEDFFGNMLSESQLRELLKVYERRKGVKNK